MPVGAFDYLAVLISIILGLAIAQVLQSYRGLALARTRTTVFWPTLIWSLLVLLLAVQSWWAMFGLHALTVWRFADFAIVLAQAIGVYMLAALVLPDFGGEAPIDLAAHYANHRRLFFGALALVVNQRDGRPLAAEPVSRGQSDARSRPSDQGDLAM